MDGLEKRRGEEDQLWEILGVEVGRGGLMEGEAKVWKEVGDIEEKEGKAEKELREKAREEAKKKKLGVK